MEVRRFDDPAAFFAHAAPFLEAHEAQHNLLLGLRERLIADPHVFGPEDPYLATVEDGRRIVGAAFRTPPHLLGLCRFDDLDGVALLADDLAGADLPGVAGPRDAAERFAARWVGVAGAAVTRAMPQGIYEATSVVPPAGVSGAMRDYDSRDRDLVVAWIDAFVAEARPPGPVGDPAEWIDRRIADPDGGIVVWDDAGAASLASFGSPTPTGIRVGLVYTPPERRGRGYASAVTAALTRRLLAGGRKRVFLFTDLANPTSNAIYQRIGYRRVGDVIALMFERA